ncbi:hypothetical protein [Clostridium psychrophilum]|uniref:hypothetical protein n=1 Tax=Clostridium psychrophilum TaxID=132926 RepID=UPI001C0E584E|nr:hypothetical protein [Clostridium psychrophilum]MBU3183098.1 hypothetical protein [Clostridium psychrophilum]
MNCKEEMDWKEQLALQFRKLTIDTNIISKAMQNFVDIFNGSLDKYNVKDVQATTDSKNYIEIKGYKKIKISYYDDRITFSSIDKNGRDDMVYMNLMIVKELGRYLIVYVNAKESNPQLKDFIDENTIDEIFKNLIQANIQVTRI